MCGNRSAVFVREQNHNTVPIPAQLFSEGARETLGHSQAKVVEPKASRQQAKQAIIDRTVRWAEEYFVLFIVFLARQIRREAESKGKVAKRTRPEARGTVGRQAGRANAGTQQADRHTEAAGQAGQATGDRTAGRQNRQKASRRQTRQRLDAKTETKGA